MERLAFRECVRMIADRCKSMFRPNFESKLQFDGSNDYVDCGSGASLDDITGSVSLCAWIKANRAWYAYGTKYSYILAKDSLYRSGYTLSVYERTASEIRLVMHTRNSSGISGGDKEVGTDFARDDFVHVVGVYTSQTSYALYLNGIDISAGHDGAFYDPGNHSSYPFRIGGSTFTSSYEKPFPGWIYDARVYNVALSAEEVKGIYEGAHITRGLVSRWLINEGSGSTVYDIHGSNDGTISGASWT